MKFYWKILIGCFLAGVSHMYKFYATVGGALFSPELPRIVLIIYPWLFGGLFFLSVLCAIKDITLIVAFIFCTIKSLISKIVSNTVGNSFRPILFLTSSNMRKQTVYIFTTLALLISMYGIYEAIKIPGVKTREITIKDLPKELVGLKLIFLPDLHISALNQRPYAQGVVDKVNALGGDAILLGGDVIDGYVKNRINDVAPLGDLKSKYGVFFITGNHEYYSQYVSWREHFKKLNFKILENQNIILNINNKKLAIAGTTDKGPDIKKAMEGIPASIPTILLEHRPGLARSNSNYNIDYQLSGHTHGGMVIGLDRIIAKFNGGFVRGFYDVNKMKLFVSPGSGLWNGFPIRIGIPSEITVLILK
jgi:predicted MPP superfamily phosphohydrolase